MQQVRIDFDNPGLPQSLGAVEGESQSRIFQAALYKSGAAYTAPAGAVYSIMYRGFGPQNQGWYDTIEDGAGKRAACTVSGNVVTCELARQALRVPGHLTVVLCVSDAKGYMLKSWPIMADVRNDGYEDTVEVESFFYITQITSAEWTKAFAAWEDFKATIDPTLTLSGKAADAKATGAAVDKLEDKKADKTDLDTERKRIDVLNDGGLNIKDEVIDTSIKAWLTEHPEATTTVQDGAVTEQKLSILLRNKKASFYNSVSEMLEDSLLRPGMTAVTLGYYKLDDGGGSFYKIREKADSDIEDGGKTHFLENENVAENIQDDGNILKYGIVKDNVLDAKKLASFYSKNKSGYLPKGEYTLLEKITIPPYCSLKGDFSVYPNINLYTGKEDIQNFFPKANTVLFIDSARLPEDESAITVSTNSHIENIVMHSNSYEQTEDRSLLSDGKKQSIFSVKNTKKINGIKIDKWSATCDHVFVSGFGGAGIVINTYSRVFDPNVQKCGYGVQVIGQDVQLDRLKAVECGIALYVNAYCYLLQCNSLRADGIAQYGIYTKGWSGHYHDINIDGCYKAGLLIEGESNVVDYFTSRCGFEYAGITDASQIAKEDWSCYSKVAINGNKNTVTLVASIPNLTDTDSPIYGTASQVSIQSGSTLNKINLAGSLTNAPIIKNLSKYVYVHGGNAPATTIINGSNTIYFSSFDNNIESSWIDGVHYGIWWSSQFPTEDKNGTFIYKDDDSVYMYFKGKWNKITQ